MKVKMLARHTAPGGRRMERGLVYEVPPNYAQELMDHGLAVIFIITEPMEPLPEAKLTVGVGFVNTQRTPPPPRTHIFARGEKKSKAAEKKAQEDGKS